MLSAPTTATWLGVVIVSSLVLAAVVVTDLRRTVQAQADRQRAAAADDAARTARELRALLAAPDVLDRVPAEARFELGEGSVVIPPDVGWLDPPPPFDPDRDLDVLAAERLRRAEIAGDAGRALDELAPLLDAATVTPAARAWVRVHMAWRAHRGGLLVRRDELLAEMPEGGPEVAASALALRAVIDPADPAVAAAAPGVLQRLDVPRAQALAGVLAERGIDPAPARAAIGRAAARRGVLREVRGIAGSLAAATAPVVRRLGRGLLLYSPERGFGAWLDPAATAALGRQLLEPPLDRELVTGPTPDRARPVVADLLSVVPAAVPTPGPFSGPTGAALLVVALALLCGGGSFVAWRAQRREAAALRVRGEFLTTVTHELKTPLAGVRLVAELLADDYVLDPAERRDWLRRLNGEAARLGTLIQNVLDLGRLDRGERPHDPRPTDLRELVADTVALFAPLAEREGVAVELVPGGSPVPAAADRDALGQALWNLLDNARKYGGSPIRLEVRNGDPVVIAVSDAGPGVPAADRERVFERFRRGRAQADGSVPGVGLGLYLSRAIARRHGGELVCRGACFELRLPRGERGAV